MPKALSVYLDLLRFMAAMLVFIVHANYERYTGGLPILWRIGGLGNDAVMIFFVLSGFVIAYVTEARERIASEYFAARLARLWSIAIPAIALTILLDCTGIFLSPAMYDGWWFQDSWPFLRTIANLFFLNEVWFLSIRPFSNGPYWSIGYEFWYYVIFAATLFLKGPIRLAALTLLIAVVGPKILLLLPIWWAGVWAYRTNMAYVMPVWLAGAVFITTILTYVALRLTGTITLLDEAVKQIFGTAFATESLRWSQYFLSSYCIGILIALNFMAARKLSAGISDTRIPCDRLITYLAGFTFPLYLFHYPLLQFFAALTDFFAIANQKPIIVVGGSLVVVWILGTWAERQKAPLRRFLLRLLARLRWPKPVAVRE